VSVVLKNKTIDLKYFIHWLFTTTYTKYWCMNKKVIIIIVLFLFIFSDYLSVQNINANSLQKVTTTTNNSKNVDISVDDKNNYFEILLLSKDKEIKIAEIQKQRALQYTLTVLILLFLIIVILTFNIYRLKQQNSGNILEKEKLALENKLLRSQMNPHFLFNSLNSIQSFISSNESFKAMTYLSKFGKFIRNILEYSSHSYITLSKEISNLELYIELEILRFKDNIKYNISVDKNIDVETTLIPPIIVQPFVENALIQRLRQKQDEGLLEINFRMQHDKLLCTISDNGIGRKASMLNKDKDHHSLGIQITTERLQNLNRKARSDIRFAITDLYDNSGTAVGTKVVITLPKKNNVKTVPLPPY